MNRRPAAGGAAPGFQSDHRPAGGLGELDIQRFDIFGNQLPLRTGSQCALKLFRRYRRRQQGRDSDQGLQLYGNPVSDQGGGF